MNKLLALFFCFLCCSTLHAQTRKGFIKTPKGYLIYENKANQAYTVNLEGNVDLYYIPFVLYNGNTLQLLSAPKKGFGFKPKEILKNYMNWEKKYIEAQFNVKIPIKNKLLKKEEQQFNFWYFEHPTYANLETDKPIKFSYFLDFIQKDFVFRISIATDSNDKTTIRNKLLDIFTKYKFYDHSIDIEDLKDKIYRESISISI